MTRWEACGRAIVTDATVPRVMGIVNVTPDSFSDGGRAGGLEARGGSCPEAGGRGGRPARRRRRVEPAGGRAGAARRGAPARRSRWSRRWRRGSRVPISVDTTKAEVARRALAAGASIINDIQALGGDPELARVVAESGAGVVLMHMAGTPRTMQDDPRYGDVVAEVRDFLARRIAAAEAAGHRPVADRDRPRHRLRQDVGAQPGALAEPRSICHPGMCGPDRHLAQGAPRHVDRPARRPACRGLGRLVAGGGRPRGRRRPRPRRRGDGRCHQDHGPQFTVGTMRHEPGDRVGSGRGRSRRTVGGATHDLAAECRTLAERCQGCRAGAGHRPRRGQERLAAARRPRRSSRRSGEVLAANARDVAAAPGFGLNAAAIDRLTLEPEAARRHGPRPARGRRAARPGRRGRGLEPAAQRPRRHPGPRPARRRSS